MVYDRVTFHGTGDYYSSEKEKRAPPSARIYLGMATGAKYLRYIILACFYFYSSSSSLRTRTGLRGPSSDQVSLQNNASHGPPPKPAAGLPLPQAGGQKVNATFVTLARNSDTWDIARSIRQVEDRFNRKFHYDWVFLNDEPFDENFKKVTTALVSGTTKYGVIPKEHWSFPDWIDQNKAAKVREEMSEKKIIYGDSISYRHMCRYESGFFFRHQLMLDYDWYWRVEPGVEFFCDINEDPFKFMADNGKKYGFTISLYEYGDTIPTLWKTAKKFMDEHPQYVAEDNAIAFLSDDGGDTYNLCHFWSNFEIGNLNWLRSQAYIDYFNALDKDGGFFYERWGDAPVHSIAAGMMLKKDEIHFFNNIAYNHVPFTHCPTGEKLRLDLKCHCNPSDNFDWKGYSCTSRFFDAVGMKKPDGYEEEQ
ncbi:alpha-1,2-mannosyltransferase KRE2 [Trichoglossum hirsutum]|uniref:Alpha-1,2-mannosyltransferase KRE2 n=1 Tax=Trichoglossum hirsutum TaxID=265104 RepID=A0A9P8LHC0_9PEZI|nr:alpha-1,2-mannosyltransferase KRE2 [Trichoglossum hirsutum]